jgi:hypothetical protein
VIHDKDPVPHVPPTELLDFYHSCSEVFQDSTGAVRTCGTSTRDSTLCEDDSCALQYRFTQTRLREHLFYLGMRVNCQHVSDIKIDEIDEADSIDPDM